MDEVSQAIGQLQGRMDAADIARGRIENKLDTQGEKIDRLLAALENQKGARRILVGLTTGGGAAIGAVVGWLVTYFSAMPP
jgi:hypothetical protein